MAFHNAVTHVKVRAAAAQEDVIAVLNLNTAVIPRNIVNRVRVGV